MLSGDADSFANQLMTPLEDGIDALADVLGGDTRQLLVTHRHCDRQRAVRSSFGAHPEVDEVLPVKRSQQERRGHAKVSEHMIGLALGIEVRNLVISQERW